MLKNSLLLLLSSLSNSRKDDPEAGPLDPRLNIGWDKLSRRIKDFIKAVNTEPASNSPVLQHGFPRDVTQQQRRFPEQHVERNKGSKKHVETHVETRQRPSLLNQHKASIISLYF